MVSALLQRGGKGLKSVTGYQAVVLGIVQGLTEFLPVSSSGHLVLFRQWFGLVEPALVFEILLHFATLLAVVVFFARDIVRLSKRGWLMILIGSIPAGLIGVLFDDLIESFFSSIILVGLTLLMTGLFNWFSNRILEKADQQQESAQSGLDLTVKQSLIIGSFQALALVPGISRSGSTVFAGLKQGLDRFQAFRFSFILSIPAILGAVGLQLWRLPPTTMTKLFSGPYLLGALSAFISGLLSLYLLKLVIKRANLSYFAYYCWVLGALIGLSTVF